MIDTIKVGIPLTEKQFLKIRNTAYDSDREQWAKIKLNTGEINLLRISGLAELDQHSYHRDIRWDISGHYIPGENYLTVELSLPKLFYGHNVSLLYAWTKALHILKDCLEKAFRLTRLKLPDISTWQVWRADICYAWRCPSQSTAQQLLNSLKHLHYPRKKPITYETSIVFPGRLSSLKFYLKLPEFMAHDRKELLKEKASLDWIDHLEALANGVLRFEITLRRQALKRLGFQTVADLAQTNTELIWDETFTEQDFNPNLAIACITAWNSTKNLPGSTQLSDGLRLEAPAGQFRIDADTPMIYNHPGGGFTVSRQDVLVATALKFLIKFLGDNVGMEKADQIQAKLLEHYKPVKAARLVSFWLYAQKFGTQEAKESFGHNSYYVAKRDLKKAGISLIEKPKIVTSANLEFINKFRFNIPSEYAVNKIDDFRDHSNILNYPVKSLESDV